MKLAIISSVNILIIIKMFNFNIWCHISTLSSFGVECIVNKQITCVICFTLFASVSSSNDEIFI